MKNIEFIPKNQKVLNPRIKQDPLVYMLLTLLIVYISIVGSSYWLFLVQEKNKITQNIQVLDTKNKDYYRTNNLEQDLFNITNILSKSYDPTPVIKAIESAYVPGADISKLSYNKVKKSINISMTVPSLGDTTKQVTTFEKLPLVSVVNTSAVSAQKDNGFTFNIEILLK